MTRLILVRHARSVANAQGILAGRSPGVDLDETGKQQALDLATLLADVEIDFIVRSSLIRTAQTIAPFIESHSHIPVHIDDRITECDYGDWTGKSLGELAKDPLWKVVLKNPSHVTFPQGESMKAMALRAAACVNFWNQETDKTWLMVAHGDVIKSILADALSMHLDSFQRIGVQPASISIVDFAPTSESVLTMNHTDLKSLHGMLKHAKVEPTTGGGDVVV
jgi:probable phosphomutase (TIGR03848 family)